MFRIDGTKMILTKGDTAEFRPIVEGYEAKEGDEIIFRVAKLYTDEPVIEIVVAAGDNIEFTSEDTSNLPTGSYLYQTKLVNVDGKISTFATGTFMLMGEINARTEG